MHINAMRAFINDHPIVIDEQLTTSGINRKNFKPETEGTSKLYIDTLANTNDPQTGIPYVSAATVFVSHAWTYRFYDVVVKCMEQYTVTNPNAYFWFDLFTNDQNSVANKDFEWFSSTFGNGVREIGQVLLVLSPWNDPIPITRSWCLFEIHNALEESMVNLSIDIPDTEVVELREGVIKSSDSIIQILTDIQAEKATATSAADKEMIFQVIRESSDGFPRVNQEVKKELRSWYIDKLKGLIKVEPENPNFLMQCTGVMQNFGYYDEALDSPLQCNQIVYWYPWR